MGWSARSWPPFVLVALLGCPNSGTIVVDDDGPSGYAEAMVADVSWSLHPQFGSLVVVSWEQLAPATAWVEASVDEGHWLASPAQAVDEGGCSDLVLGIPFGTLASLRVANDFGEGPLYAPAVTATTGPLPEGFPPPELLESDPDRFDADGQYLIGSVNEDTGGWTGGNYWKWILDRQGRVIWAHLTPDHHWTLYMRVSQDGDDLLWDQQTFWPEWDEGAGSVVHRWKIDGTVVESTATPGLHHAFTELPDETLVWGAADWETESLVERPPGGVVSTIWRCDEFHALVGSDEICQSNSLYWHEPSDSFLYSFYTTSTVVEIDHATGDSLRWWGHLPGAWDFDPVESAFYWQHGAVFTEAGTLLLSSYREEMIPEGVVREYELDEGAETLRQIWHFGEGEYLWAVTAGEAHRLPGGNTLHNQGSGGRLREITPDGQVVWDVAFGERLLGRTVFVDDLYAFAP
jgi:hypothetical protein